MPRFRRTSVLVALWVAAAFLLPFAVPDDAPGWVRAAVAAVMVAVPVVWLVAACVRVVRLVRQDRRNAGG